MPDLRKLQTCYADPSIFPMNVHANVPTRKGERAKSLSEIYAENGIDFLSPFHGDHSDVSFAARLLMHWANLEDREPTVKIVCRQSWERPSYGLHGWDCPNLLWELERTRPKRFDPQQLLTRNAFGSHRPEKTITHATPANTFCFLIPSRRGKNARAPVSPSASTNFSKRKI